MSTVFRKLEIPPGVVAMATKQVNSSNWAEVNMVRWVEGQMTPIGGQAPYPYQFASRCRCIHGWFGLDQVYRIAYLCEANLYVDQGGVLTDITPSGGMTSPSSEIAGGYGTGMYSQDNYGTPRPPGTPLPPIANLPNAYSLDNFGSLLYAMTSVDTRLLVWDPSLGTQTGTEAAAGAFTTASTSITMAANLGWVRPGMSVYDTTTSKFLGVVLTYAGTTLTLGSAGTAVPPLAASSGAADVLQFSNSAIEQVGAPLGRCFVVTPERFIQVFGQFSDGTTGGGSARRFGWCDQENPASWSFGDVTSQAGFLDVEPASPIVCALATRHGTIFWTATTAFLSQFVGLPYIYNYVWLADSCTPWSPESMITTSAMAFWMSEQGMFGFDGTSIGPVPCGVRTWINDDIDTVNVRDVACAVHVAPFNEFWWCFPQKGQPYNTRVAIFNYKEQWWSEAQMSRSAGVTASYTTSTIMADGLTAYHHETLAPGQPILTYQPDVPLPWAESFDLNITPNGSLITVKQMIPDIQAPNASDPVTIANAITNLRYSLFYRMSRSLGAAEQQTVPRSVRADGYVDFRTTGRDIRLKIELAGPNVLPITVGQHLVDAVQRGDR
jgi:hypothetical protein